MRDEMGAIEVEAVGTGFLKIAREVFDHLAQAHPDWKRNGAPSMSAAVRANYYRFFRFPDDDIEEPGEDIEFCREWRRNGGEVWIDPAIRLGHVGEKEYSGDFTALLEPEMKLVEFNRAEPGIHQGQQRVIEDGFADKLAEQGKVTVLKEGAAVFEQEPPERVGPPTRRKQTRAKTAA